MSATQRGEWKGYGGRLVCVPLYRAPVAVEWTAADGAALARQEWGGNVRHWLTVALVLWSGAALTFALAMATGGF